MISAATAAAAGKNGEAVHRRQTGAARAARTQIERTEDSVDDNINETKMIRLPEEI